MGKQKAKGQKGWLEGFGDDTADFGWKTGSLEFGGARAVWRNNSGGTRVFEGVTRSGLTMQRILWQRLLHGRHYNGGHFVRVS